MTAAISKARSCSRDRSGFPDAKAGRRMSVLQNGRERDRRDFAFLATIVPVGEARGHAPASLDSRKLRQQTPPGSRLAIPRAAWLLYGELGGLLNVSPGTVTGMLKHSGGNLATYKCPASWASPIESGNDSAMKVIRRHRLLERFLAETLTMSWDEVHEEAEHMEHAASERLIDRIDAYLGYPAVDPHGDPIPRADGSLAQIEGVPLARCQAGQHFRVVRVMDQDPAFLRYLSECGLELHAAGELLENRPEAGALVCLLGGRNVALGLAAARSSPRRGTRHRLPASR